MSDIYIQGETLQVGKKFDSALIEGFNETFETMRPKIIAATGSGPAPSGGGGLIFREYKDSILLDTITLSINVTGEVVS